MDKRLLQLGLSLLVLWVMSGSFILPESPHSTTVPRVLPGPSRVGKS